GIERDAVTIFSTYIAKGSPKPIGVDDTLRAEPISKICQENGEVDPECFASCRRFVLNKLESDCSYQIFSVLLYGGKICYFMEVRFVTLWRFYLHLQFMEQEGASDLMQMWLGAENFQQLLSTSGSYNCEQAQIVAMVLYDRYFSLQATNPVGFSDKMRFEIEDVCMPGCFTTAKNIVLKIIDK
ncbi:unnamed protein product, partial [Lymnaea stagnalis]